MEGRGRRRNDDKASTPAPVPGRVLVERSTSEERARASVHTEEVHGGSRSKPALTTAVLLATVRALQEKQPRGARFVEILRAMKPAFPNLSETSLRRELGVLLKRAVYSKQLQRDLRSNYTVLKKTLAHAEPEDDASQGVQSWPTQENSRPKPNAQRRPTQKPGRRPKTSRKRNS